MKTRKTVTETTSRKIENKLIKWFEAANALDIESGKAWYREAQTYAQFLSETFKIDSYTCAAVISALSPNNKWERNKVDAFNVIQAFKAKKKPEDVSCCTYNANKQKAFEILKGNLELSAKSPKTHAFAMNVGLLSPDHITVDKWHIRACLTSPSDGIKETVEVVTPAQYRRLEAITVKVAKKYGLKGFEFQAIVWVTIKRKWNR